MSYILITNSDGVSLSLVHADNEGAYLDNHGVKGQRWGVRRFQNPDVSLTEKAKLNSPKNKDSYALTNHVSNVATKKDDKAHTKYVHEAKNAAEYDDYITKHQNKETKIDHKKIKVESKLNPLKEIDAKYARSLAEKVDKRKDKK